MQQLVRQHASRLQELHVIFRSNARGKDSYQWQQFQRSFFPSDDFVASQLESLTVVVENTPSNQPKFLPFLGVQDTDVAPPLLRGRSPNLKKLSLRHNSWLTGNELRCLTHLCLSDCPFISVPSLVAFLSENPGLEELVLTNLDSTLDFVLSSTELVRLSNMRRLVLENHNTVFSRVMFELIRHIEFGFATIPRIPVALTHYDLIIAGRPAAMLCVDTTVLVPSTGFFSTIALAKNTEKGFRVEEPRPRLSDKVPEFLFHWSYEVWLARAPSLYDFWTDARLHAFFRFYSTLKTLVLCEEHVKRILDAFPDDAASLFRPRQLKRMHVFLSDPTADSPGLIRRFTIMLTGWPCWPLTAFDVGFVDSDAMEQFRAAVTLPLEGQTIIRLKLYSEMPILKLPRASTTDTHRLWPSWADSFPLNLFD